MVVSHIDSGCNLHMSNMSWNDKSVHHASVRPLKQPSSLIKQQPNIIRNQLLTFTCGITSQDFAFETANKITVTREVVGICDSPLLFCRNVCLPTTAFARMSVIKTICWKQHMLSKYMLTPESSSWFLRFCPYGSLDERYWCKFMFHVSFVLLGLSIPSVSSFFRGSSTLYNFQLISQFVCNSLKVLVI